MVSTEPATAPRNSRDSARKSELSCKDPSGDVEGGTALAVKVEYHDIYDGEDSAVDPVYYAKARVLNAAIQEIGMGKYQVSTTTSSPGRVN